MTPRTLVISPFVFNYQNGSGVTFSNLFSGWPKDKLANLHSSGQTPDYSVCENFFRMTNRDIHRPWPFTRKDTGSTLGASPTSTPKSSFWRDIVVGNSGLPQSFKASPELTAWLDKFKPEVIYTILGPIPHMEACLEIKKKYGTKLVIHFMDDWYHQAYTTGIFRFQRKKMLRLFHELLDSADAHLTICDRMTDEFASRYKIQPEAFQNTISVSNFIHDIEKSKSRREDPKARRILYFGSVLPFAQLEAIQFIAAANKRLNEQAKTNHTLRIVTSGECMPVCQEAFGDNESVELIPMNGSANQFMEELANAEILLLPANFNPQSEEFLRFSMPTKIPGYLASGVPVLVFAPKSIAQTMYAKESGWGLCVEENETECVEAIRKLSSDSNLRQRLSANAREAARKNHDTQVVRSRFQEILQNLK